MRLLLILLLTIPFACSESSSRTDAGPDGDVDVDVVVDVDVDEHPDADADAYSEPDEDIGGDDGGMGDDGGGDDGGADEEEFPWTPVEINVPNGYLCDIPPDYVENGGDPVYISCALEADRFSDRDPDDVPAQLKLVTWNVQYGANSAKILDHLQNHADLAGADFLLLSEVSRNDLKSDPPGINQAREMAQALAMDYVFAVEWDRRLIPEEMGEHGVVVLSKYPLGNVVQIRHVPLSDWYGDENRYGGRMTLAVDAKVGGRLLRLYSAHLCTRGGEDGRAEQAAEIHADSEVRPEPAPRILGGDLNTWTCNPTVADCTKPPSAEKLVVQFLTHDWFDGTEGYTSYTQLGDGFFPQRLDWIFYRDLSVIPGSCAKDADGSDHFPLHFLFTPP